MCLEREILLEATTVRPRTAAAAKRSPNKRPKPLDKLDDSIDKMVASYNASVKRMPKSSDKKGPEKRPVGAKKTSLARKQPMRNRSQANGLGRLPGVGLC